MRSTVGIGATGGCAQLNLVRLVICKDICRAHNNMFPCARVHFERLIFPWTDAALGNCSYLDTCRHMKTCRYVHYQLDDQPDCHDPGSCWSHAAKPKAAVPKLPGGEHKLNPVHTLACILNHSRHAGAAVIGSACVLAWLILLRSLFLSVQHHAQACHCLPWHECRYVGRCFGACDCTMTESCTKTLIFP